MMHSLQVMIKMKHISSGLNGSPRHILKKYVNEKNRLTPGLSWDYVRWPQYYLWRR